MSKTKYFIPDYKELSELIWSNLSSIDNLALEMDDYDPVGLNIIIVKVREITKELRKFEEENIDLDLKL